MPDLCSVGRRHACCIRKYRQTKTNPISPFLLPFPIYTYACMHIYMYVLTQALSTLPVLCPNALLECAHRLHHPFHLLLRRQDRRAEVQRVGLLTKPRAGHNNNPAALQKLQRPSRVGPKLSPLLRVQLLIV
ncbi:alanine transaminase, partial [Trypanosoma cruzi]